MTTFDPMHPLICASAQQSGKNLNEINGAASPGWKAVSTLRAHGFLPYDTLTTDVEREFWSSYLTVGPFQYTTTGEPIDCPEAYGIMTSTDTPETLSSSEVLLLIMTCDSPCMVTESEKTRQAKERQVDAEAHRRAMKADTRKQSDDGRRTRGGRIDWRSKLIASTNLPAAHRWTPLNDLSAKQKLAMTASLKAADARRQERIEPKPPETDD